MMYGILLGSLLICCTRKEYISKPVVQPFLKVGFRNSSKQPKVPADFDSDSSEDFHKRPTPGEWSLFYPFLEYSAPCVSNYFLKFMAKFSCGFSCKSVILGEVTV